MPAGPHRSCAPNRLRRSPAFGRSWSTWGPDGPNLRVSAPRASWGLAGPQGAVVQKVQAYMPVMAGLTVKAETCHDTAEVDVGSGVKRASHPFPRLIKATETASRSSCETCSRLLDGAPGQSAEDGVMDLRKVDAGRYLELVPDRFEVDRSLKTTPPPIGVHDEATVLSRTFPRRTRRSTIGSRSAYG